MKVKDGYIYLRDVRLRAGHGVANQERTVGADFALDLRAGLDLSLPVVSDRVADTVSYADLYAIARQQMAEPSRLLEHAAGRIGQAILDAFPQITTLDIRLTKLNPPMGADSEGAGVELHLTND